jgi:hypothetical protein
MARKRNRPVVVKVPRGDGVTYAPWEAMAASRPLKPPPTKFERRPSRASELALARDIAAGIVRPREDDYRCARATGASHVVAYPGRLGR